MLKPVSKTEYVKARLLEDIRNGQCPPGSNLPSIEMLARFFSVSKNTVSQALLMLRDTGVIELAHGKHTRVVGFLDSPTIEIIARAVVPLENNDFWGEVRRGIHEEIHTEEKFLIRERYFNDSFVAEFKEPPEYLRHNSGIILIGTAQPEYLAHFRKYNIPVILPHDKPFAGDPTPSVHCDFSAVMRQAVGELVRAGARRIAWCGFNLLERNSPIDGHKLECFRAALAEHGLRLDPGDIRDFDPGIDKGYAETRKLLAKAKPLPDAIFFASDSLLFGAFRAFHDAGIRIPQDLKVISSDNLFWSRYVIPAVTSIELDRVEMGRRAARQLMNFISAGTPMKEEIVEPKLIKRESI